MTDMDNRPEEIGSEVAARLRELREVCGYSVQQLASELGIPAEKYEGYERSGEDIPISLIYQVSKKFKVDFAELLSGTAAKLDTYHLVKKGCGETIERYEGYVFKDLAFRYKNKIMQPLLVTLDPSDETAALVSHAGQEFNYCLEGTVIVTFDKKELVLEQGDCLYFNPMHMHGQRCGGDKPATFLTVITE